MSEGRKESSMVEVYVGESSRTLVERAMEHVQGSRLFKENNFIVKHWFNCHGDRDEPPEMRFGVVKSFKDAMLRLLVESVWIESDSKLNSRN